MDPLGLSLEHFDALGEYREQDNGLDLDVSGEVDGVAFEGLAGLAETLADDESVDRCTVARFYEFTFGRVSDSDDKASVADLVDSFGENDGRYASLVRALLLHDAFRLASDPK